MNPSPPDPELRAVALRLDPETLAKIEAMRDRLHGPSRAALLRFLVREGLSLTEERLARSGAVSHPRI